MMKKRCCALCAVILLVLAAASADPVMTNGSYTSYLGESNYLYLIDPTGNVRMLRAPISDLLGMTQDALYCLTTENKIYAITLDGTAKASVYSSEPTELDVAAVTRVKPYTLAEGVLTLVPSTDPAAITLQNGAPLSQTASAVCADAQYVYWVETDGEKSRLMRADYVSGGTAEVLDADVPAAVSLTVSPEGWALVCADRSVLAIDTGMARTVLAPASEQTDIAVMIDRKVFRFTRDENGRYLFENETALDPTAADVSAKLGSTAQTAAPAVTTVKPTDTPKPTATAKPTAKATAKPKPTATPDDGIRYGQKGSGVKKMQNRLIELGYPLDKADGVYGANTKLAVNLFQHAIGYKERSHVTAACLKKLYAKGAPAYDACEPIKQGAKGAVVLVMQTALKDQGYDPGDLDGAFGKKTIAALKAFQKAKKLKEDGEATRETLMALYEIPDPNPTAKPTAKPTPTVSAPSTNSPKPTIPQVTPTDPGSDPDASDTDL